MVLSYSGSFRNLGERAVPPSWLAMHRGSQSQELRTNSASRDSAKPAVIYAGLAPTIHVDDCRSPVRCGPLPGEGYTNRNNEACPASCPPGRTRSYHPACRCSYDPRYRRRHTVYTRETDSYFRLRGANFGSAPSLWSFHGIRITCSICKQLHLPCDLLPSRSWPARILQIACPPILFAELQVMQHWSAARCPLMTVS